MHPSEQHTRRLIRAALIVISTAAVLVAAATPSGERPGRHQPVALDTGTRAAPPPAAPGYRVHLDADGTPVVPAPAAMPSATVRSHASTIQTDRPALVETDTPGGGKMVVLDGRFRSYAVARLGDGGDVSVECTRAVTESSTDEGSATPGNPPQGAARGAAGDGTSGTGSPAVRGCVP